MVLEQAAGSAEVLYSLVRRATEIYKCLRSLWLPSFMDVLELLTSHLSAYLEVAMDRLGLVYVIGFAGNNMLKLGITTWKGFRALWIAGQT